MEKAKIVELINSLEHRLPETYAISPARSVLRRGYGHCLETALAAAFLMERIGIHPKILYLEIEGNAERAGHALYYYPEDGRINTLGKSSIPAFEGKSLNARSIEEVIDYYDRASPDHKIVYSATFDLRGTKKNWRTSKGWFKTSEDILVKKTWENKDKKVEKNYLSDF